MSFRNMDRALVTILTPFILHPSSFILVKDCLLQRPQAFVGTPECEEGLRLLDVRAGAIRLKFQDVAERRQRVLIATGLKKRFGVVEQRFSIVAVQFDQPSV